MRQQQEKGRQRNANGGARPVVSLGRHEAQCSICSHGQREEIEQEFVGWKSPEKIAEQFGVCRDSIYRHARALDLLEPRRRNVKAALERIIERAGEVEVNAHAVVCPRWHPIRS